MKKGTLKFFDGDSPLEKVSCSMFNCVIEYKDGTTMREEVSNYAYENVFNYLIEKYGIDERTINKIEISSN